MSIVLADAVRRKQLGQNSIARSCEGIHSPSSWGCVIPGEEATSPEHVYAASQQLVAAGLSVIPIEAYEGSKAPDGFRLPHPRDPVDGRHKPSWSIYQLRRPTEVELRRWYEVGSPYGLAVLGGAVSGGRHGFGLEVIDFDHADLAEPWQKIVEQKAPGLIDRLVRVRTPRPGMHCYYRCSRFGVSQKLAFSFVRDDLGKQEVDVQGNPVRKAVIEVKAEGGYCLVPPSPPRCHPTGRLYQYVEGSPDLTHVPTITPEEREIIIGSARSLSQGQEPKQPVHRRPSKPKSASLDLPGRDFNARGCWADILMPHGWVMISNYGDETRWCRPGKDGSVSATINHHGSDRLHVFTSSTEFDQDGWYDKFGAYAKLNHGGDLRKAAQDLRRQGYGKQQGK